MVNFYYFSIRLKNIKRQLRVSWTLYENFSFTKGVNRKKLFSFSYIWTKVLNTCRNAS